MIMLFGFGVAAFAVMALTIGIMVGRWGTRATRPTRSQLPARYIRGNHRHSGVL